MKEEVTGKQPWQSLVGGWKEGKRQMGRRREAMLNSIIEGSYEELKERARERVLVNKDLRGSKGCHTQEEEDLPGCNMCTGTVYSHCVQALCKALCTGTVYRHCVQSLCTGTVYRHCVQSLCTGTVYRHCVQALCTVTVYSHCVQSLCTRHCVLGTVY